MDSQFKYSAESIRRKIEDTLNGAGILCRVFGRGKSNQSIRKKLEKENGKYYSSTKKLQDAIGIRVVIYFSDDIEIVKNIIEKQYTLLENDSTIDTPNGNEFSVTRYNLVFKVPHDEKESIEREINGRYIDDTFELQIRSVLSEGWHEVEHDLRYKQKEYWVGHDDLSRSLNGIVATLETSEWAMKRIFDDLAYKNYKQKKWDAMITLKLRMRISGNLKNEIKEIFYENNETAKQFLRINRSDIMFLFSTIRPRLPITLENAVYLWNKKAVKCEKISNLTPKLIIDNP